jgi:hypothetical protein
LTFLDQALSSLTNFGGAALAAGLLSASDFGAFAVATSVLVIALGVVRSWTGNSLMILAPTVGIDPYKRMLSGALGTAVVVGIGSSGLIVLAALLTRGALQTALMCLAIFVPVVSAQDALRLGPLSQRNPRVACWNDGAWLVVAVASLMVLRRTDTMSLALAIIAAIGTAAVGVATALRLDPIGVSIRATREWIALATPTALRMTADFVIALSYSAVPLVLITAWQADLASAGALRTAAILLGPLSVIYAGSTLYMQPRFAAARRDRRRVFRLAKSQSIWNTAVACVWVGLALVIPDQVGIRIFGASWEGSSESVLALGIAFIAMAIPTGPLTALRGCAQLNANLLTQAMIGVVVLGCTALGGLSVADGMLRGFALGHLLSGVVAWCVFSRVRLPEPNQDHLLD